MPIIQTPCVFTSTKIPLQIFNNVAESPIKINPSSLFFKEEIWVFSKILSHIGLSLRWYDKFPPCHSFPPTTPILYTKLLSHYF